MDRQAIIDALRRRAAQASDAYMQYVGNPARQLVGGGVRGYLGLDAPEYADASGMEAYRNAAALSNAPGVGAPAGAFKAMAAAPLAIKALRALPREEAMETARKNAVQMLGLPENNTPMDRARALGFDTQAYHGTNRDFPAFSDKMLGAKTGAKSAKKAHFSASNPEVANTYVNLSHVNPLPWKSSPPVYEKILNNPKAWAEFSAAADDAEKWRVLEKYGMNQGSGQVMPLMIRQGKQTVKDYGGQNYRDETYNDILKAAKKNRKNSVVFKNTYDPGPHEGYDVQTDVYAVFDPSRIRSRFAAFDPDRVNENDLLGRADPRLLAGIAAGTGAAATVEALRNRREEDKKKRGKDKDE
jgi:hypothetical protein